MKKGDPFFTVAESLAELCPAVMWKIELVYNEIGHRAEELSKQSVEYASWLFLTAYSKLQKERDELRKELFFYFIEV